MCVFAAGAGYAWLAEQVMAVDARNPQVAARLVEPLIHWRKYSKETGDLMCVSLKALSNANVSNDVLELVMKAMPKS